METQLTMYMCLLGNFFCVYNLTKFSFVSLLAVIPRRSNRASLTFKQTMMIVCSFTRQRLFGNEQRFKFEEEFACIDLPWSPLSPLSPSRPSLPGTPLCPGSPGMPGCPQTQPLFCICSCATHLAIQRRSSKVWMHLICNIAIIAHKIRVRLMLRSRLKVKPFWIINGWIILRQKNSERGSQDGDQNGRELWTKEAFRPFHWSGCLFWITYWAVGYTSPMPLRNS